MELGSKLKAQTFSEYAMFVAAVVIALVAMQVYFGRAVQGRQKHYTDYMALGAEGFSPRSSDYVKISETLPFGSTRTETLHNRNGADMFSHTEDLDHRITRVVSGDTSQTSLSGSAFFSSDAPAELRALFADVSVDTDYSIGNRHSVVDYFSNERLSEAAFLVED